MLLVLSKKEKEFIDYLNKERMKQLEISKKNMDSINIKVHDFKHQLMVLQRQNAIDKEYLQDLK